MSDDAIYPSLRGRAVLVTGGASGIGASIVEHFARQGSRVACIDIAADPASQLAARLVQAGHDAPYFAQADIIDIGALRAAIAACAAAVGEFDVLVNNAGHDERHRWEDVTEDYWDSRLAFIDIAADPASQL
ncbi:MAG: SDR family NAD(P)-dependent oxidoreductase, partial [Acetobacteraceae bacterium]|nr:SDR family NAD(P)-dependent oxidoreductase [Acetobacteraceae bacterium]